MSPPVARLRRVSKSFGHGPALVQALQGVDLDIQAGELTLIEGPSGSGKTTLLHILGLLQRPDVGEVWIGERRIDGLPESRLPDERAANVALIFQGYNLLDALTAADNVALADLLRGCERASGRASEPRPSGRKSHRQGEVSGGRNSVTDATARHECRGSGSTFATGGERYLARFGLAGRARSLPAELSGGEKQRVAIARALASPGRLVLADEPTANLDWTNAQQVVRFLADLAHEEGRAVIMVSHDSRLEPFADRIVGLLNGQLFSDRRQAPDSGWQGQEGRTMPNMDNVSASGEELRPELVPTKSGGQAELVASALPAPVASAPRGRREAEGDASAATGETPVPQRDDATDRRGGGPPGSQRGGAVDSRCGGSTILWLCVLVLIAITAATVCRTFRPLAEAPSPLPIPLSPSPYVAAAPAVVEPGTQLVALRTERQGRIKSIPKRAGERIRQGEPLVLLDDATAKALVDQRRADLRLAEATLTQLKAWDRPEIRAKAKAGVEQAQARRDRAERELARIRKLYESSAAGETELNAAVEEQRQAAAVLDEARQVSAMSEAGPQPEEVGVAEARVEQAQSALRMAETELSLRTILSPLDGHVIYRHLEPGEVVDPESPVPILSLGNLDDIRLRAEVDEADIQRVSVGQRVVATAAAYGDRLFIGRVVHLEPLMGRKTIRTERTTEQQDTKVREVLIELEAGTPELPVDLQMTVRFLATPATSPKTSEHQLRFGRGVGSVAGARGLLVPTGYQVGVVSSPYALLIVTSHSGSGGPRLIGASIPRHPMHSSTPQWAT